MLKTGLELLHRGLAVVPLPYGKKAKPAKFEGRPAATEAQVRAWAADPRWGQWAIRTGYVEGARVHVGVIDVDVKHGINGWDTLATFEAQLGALPRDTYSQESPTGGTHLFYLLPSGTPQLRGEQSHIGGQTAPNVDTRFNNNYVVAAGGCWIDDKGTFIGSYTGHRESDGRIAFKRLEQTWVDFIAARQSAPEVTLSADGIPYGALSVEDRADVDAMLHRKVARVVDRLDRMATRALPKGQHSGDPWDVSVMQAARDLVKWANHRSNSFDPASTLALHESLLLAHAPTDDSFPTAMVQAKWANAIRHCGGAGESMLGLVERERRGELPGEHRQASPPAMELPDHPIFNELTEDERKQAVLLRTRKRAEAAVRAYERRGVAITDLAVTASEIDDLADSESLVDGLLPMDGVAMLVGPSGLGKSAFALHLAMGVASGATVLGHHTRPSRTLYVYAEGRGGLRRRKAAIQAAWPDVRPDDSMFTVIPNAVDLSNDYAAAELAAYARDGGFEFVVVDTLNATFGAFEENSASDMGAYMVRIKALVAETGGTALVLHHTGLNKETLGRGRGSGAAYNASDVVLLMEGEQGSPWTLKVTKDKEGAQRTVGTFVTKPAHGSVIVEGTTSWQRQVDDGLGLIGSTGRVAAHERLLTIFDESDSGKGLTERQILDLAADAGIPRSTRYSALKRLVTDKSLALDGRSGRYKRRA